MISISHLNSKAVYVRLQKCLKMAHHTGIYMLKSEGVEKHYIGDELSLGDGRCINGTQ